MTYLGSMIQLSHAPRVWENEFLPYGSHTCPAAPALLGLESSLTSQRWQAPWRPQTSFLSLTQINDHCSFSRKDATTGNGEQSSHFSVSSGASRHHPTSRGSGHHHQQTQMNAVVSGVGVEPQCCSGKCSGKQMDITKEPPAVRLPLGYHFN